MIPHIIHQTWKTERIPEQFQSLTSTWRDHHPDWQYRLWSDADNRAFLAEHYPGFLPIFDAYRSPICRADAIRYFLLKHYGGLYVDLDFECLQPFDPLTETDWVLLGDEPESHVRDQLKSFPDLTHIVCNALMASPPQHPFWDHVIALMVEARSEPGPLVATGPLLLTRAVETYQGDAPVRVFDSPVFYPANVHDCSEGRLFNIEYWQKLTAASFAMHHWAGSWWRTSNEQSPLPSTTARATLLESGHEIGDVLLDCRQYQRLASVTPLISCLMVTRNRPAQGKLAVRAFLDQTYPARELVILDDGEDDGLRDFLFSLADPRIRIFKPAENNSTLGDLRNRSVTLARGDYVCQWDDDDVYDPARLETQMTVLLALRAEACFLGRWLIWWPESQRLSVSTRRIWEGSMLCLKSRMPVYPSLRRGEDTPVADHIVRTCRVAQLDQARLYVYVAHTGNTFQAEHFEAHWQASEHRFEGPDYPRVIQELGKRLPLDSYRGLAKSSVDHVATQANDIAAKPASVIEPARTASAEPKTPSLTIRGVADLPTVLVLTPIKNAAHHVPGYFERLKNLDYPANKLSLAFLEGDSQDGTYDALQELAASYRHHLARIDIFNHSYGLRIDGDRTSVEIQYLRRAILAKCRNRLFRDGYQGEDKVLWIDADVIDYPADSLLRLLEQNKSIIVPNCVTIPGGPSFDLNTFQYKHAATAWTHMLDGIIQPPRGFNRIYLDSLRDEPLVEVDCVGGTMLLVDAKVHESGILFPDYSYRGHVETEGFALLAKDRGLTAWALPGLEIVHAPD